MKKLPWYIRYSPTFFCIVAAIKFVEAALLAVGYQAWTHERIPSDSAHLLMGFKLLDAVLYAFAWLGSAVIAKLLLILVDRVGPFDA